MKKASGRVERARKAPRPGGWVVQLCTVEVSTALASRDKHFPIRQQRRRVKDTSRVEAAGKGPTRIARLRNG